jgi:hypothetical protein
MRKMDRRKSLSIFFGDDRKEVVKIGRHFTIIEAGGAYLS